MAPRAAGPASGPKTSPMRPCKDARGAPPEMAAEMEVATATAIKAEIHPAAGLVHRAWKQLEGTGRSMARPACRTLSTAVQGRALGRDRSRDAALAVSHTGRAGRTHAGARRHGLHGRTRASSRPEGTISKDATHACTGPRMHACMRAEGPGSARGRGRAPAAGGWTAGAGHACLHQSNLLVRGLHRPRRGTRMHERAIHARMRARWMTQAMRCACVLAFAFHASSRRSTCGTACHRRRRWLVPKHIKSGTMSSRSLTRQAAQYRGQRCRSRARASGLCRYRFGRPPGAGARPARSRVSRAPACPAPSARAARPAGRAS